MTSRISKWTGFTTAVLLLLGLSFVIWFYAFARPPTKGPDWGWHSPTASNLFELRARVEKADEYALRGSQRMASESYIQAALYFSRALIKLPHTPITGDRKAAYQKQLRVSIQQIFR